MKRLYIKLCHVIEMFIKIWLFFQRMCFCEHYIQSENFTFLESTRWWRFPTSGVQNNLAVTNYQQWINICTSPVIRFKRETFLTESWQVITHGYNRLMWEVNDNDDEHLKTTVRRYLQLKRGASFRIGAIYWVSFALNFWNLNRKIAFDTCC